MNVTEVMFVFIGLNLNAAVGNLALMSAEADPDWVYGANASWSRWYRVAAGYFIVQLWPLWLITHYARGTP